MNTTHDEIRQIVSQLTAKHGPELMELVSMMSFFAHYARPVGMIGEMNMVLLTRLVLAQVQAMGKTVDALTSAVEDNERAAQTIKYLLTLPE